MIPLVSIPDKGNSPTPVVQPTLSEVVHDALKDQYGVRFISPEQELRIIDHLTCIQGIYLAGETPEQRNAVVRGCDLPGSLVAKEVG
jgi:hypothetical protein